MRTLAILLLTSAAAHAGLADASFQGTPTRQYISAWTPDGYVDIEIRKVPVPAIRIENEHGRVILDTYSTKQSAKELIEILSK